MANTLLKSDQREEIETKVSSILSKHPVFNQWEIIQAVAQEEGIRIEQADLQDLSGLLYKTDEGSWKILINKDDSLTRKLFTIAHELGHYFLHRNQANKFIDSEFSQTSYNRSENTKYQITELEANEFAANLIMPKRFLDVEIGRLKNELKTETMDSNLIFLLANKFGVSPIAMFTRLKNLEYVS
jgi:Zn-dependent peptidase ImmA (M78 family)